jgi:endoglucanase
VAAGRDARWLAIAEGLASRPTATCLEQAPAGWIRSFVRRNGRLALSEDSAGNLVVRYPSRGRATSPPLVLVAHLDHPGFVVRAVDGRRVALEFRGGVRLRHVRRGAGVEFFARGGDRPVGRGTLVAVRGQGVRGARRLAAAAARVTRGRAEAGGFAMWALPACVIRRGRIEGRALDDLLGAAAALATLDEIARARPRGARVWGLFTRAEEVGFWGALAAIRAGTVPHDARVLSLEASRALPHAPQGAGVIVRVGDARSLFHPPLVDVLVREARSLAAEDSSFRFQRRLMDGGSCEATAFCAAGYRAAGLALPLGNYHNMRGLDGGSPSIGAEHVRAADYLAEVALLVRLAGRSGRLRGLEAQADRWLPAASARAVRALAAAPLGPRRGGAGERRRS